MGPPAKKRRVDTQTNGSEPASPKIFSSEPLAPATSEEKRIWQGFCEIESEPAFFNAMLKDWGVKGVKVQEVFGLDEELLAMLPKPVHGLIFLFRYKADDINNQEATCPDNVWFANQTADFSCATVSLLNIVYNIRDAELGEKLQAFKDYTRDFTPALRGEAIENFAFVKEIHNSFARKMDMLNIDLGLKNAYDDRRKPKATAEPKQVPKKSGKKKSKVITEEDYSSDNSAFHFSAYVPIDGEVWKLDGLDRQPERLGSFDDGDWLSLTAPILQDRMAAYSEGQIEFVLLSLVRDPTDSFRAALAQNIKSIQLIESQVTVFEGTGQKFPWEDEKTPPETYGADKILDVTNEMIGNASLSTELNSQLEDSSDGRDTARLLSLRNEYIEEHNQLRREMLDEIYSTHDDEQRAWQRRHDYGPAIYAWVRMLAQKEGLMKDLVENTRLGDS